MKNERKTKTSSVKAKAFIVKKTKATTDDKKITKTITPSKTTTNIKTNVDPKNTTLCLRLISFYYVFIGALTSGLGIIIASTPSTIKENILLNFPEFVSFDPSIILNAVIITGIIFVLFGIFSVILGVYLSKLKQWARYVIIFLSVFSFFYAILNIINGLFTSIFGLILNGFIAWYLIFNKDLKKVIK